MKNESRKFVFIGLAVLAIIILIKQLFLPKGILSFFISILIAVIFGLYFMSKIKSIEK
jgi:FtsH-binding integral membrane protein